MTIRVKEKKNMMVNRHTVVVNGCETWIDVEDEELRKLKSEGVVYKILATRLEPKYIE